MFEPRPPEHPVRARIAALRDAKRSWYHLGAGLEAPELAWQMEHRPLDADAARLCEQRFVSLLAVLGRNEEHGATIALHPRGDTDAASILAVSERRALRVWAAGQATLTDPARMRLAGEPDTQTVLAVLRETDSAAVLHQGIETLRKLHDSEDRSFLLARGVPMGGRDVVWVLHNASVRTTVAWVCGELRVTPRPG